MSAERVGLGFDLHRLVPGRPCILGGVRLPHDAGPLGHSDGDAVLHAIADALLGAAGLDDLGTLFPDSDPRWKGADSQALLREVLSRVAAAGWRPLNVDLVVATEGPRIAPRSAPRSPSSSASRPRPSTSRARASRASAPSPAEPPSRSRRSVSWSARKGPELARSSRSAAGGSSCPRSSSPSRETLRLPVSRRLRLRRQDRLRPGLGLGPDPRLP